jgi:excisionase family DNA binding protein
MSAEPSLEELIRRIAREEAEKLLTERQTETGDEWLTVEQAAKLTSLGEWHIRQLVRRLLAEGSSEVYQPNPGRPPVRIRRSALRDLKAS